MKFSYLLDSSKTSCDGTELKSSIFTSQIESWKMPCAAKRFCWLTCLKCDSKAAEEGPGALAITTSYYNLLPKTPAHQSSLSKRVGCARCSMQRHSVPADARDTRDMDQQQVTKSFMKISHLECCYPYTQDRLLWPKFRLSTAARFAIRFRAVSSFSVLSRLQPSAAGPSTSTRA